MPRKRKTSESTDTGINGIDDHPTSVKRSRRTLAKYANMESFQDLLDALKLGRDEENRHLAESLKLPKRKSFPEYYAYIKNPIDFSKIQTKIKNDEYKMLMEMTQDIELIVSNAKSYYSDKSQEYKDACKLLEVYEEALAKLSEAQDAPEENGNESEATSSVGEESSADDDDPDSLFEQLFTHIYIAKDCDRLLSENFRLMPPRGKNASYYMHTRHPMDLKTIARKIQRNEYMSLAEMCKDLSLMVENAKSFYDSKTQMYKDAQALRKLIEIKRNILENAQPRKMSRRIRARRSAIGQSSHSAECAALVREEHSPNDELPDNDDSDDSDADNASSSREESALWSLWDTVRNFHDNSGNVLSDPFMRMPNRRFHPDYYNEVKRPMSLLKIKSKIKHHSYDTLDGLVCDMELVFDNAKQYNLETSTLYKSAVRLQNVMRAKRTEIEAKGDIADGVADISSSGKCKKSLKLESDASPERKKPGRKPDDPLKKRLLEIYRHVHNYKVDGRSLISIFTSLPDKKAYKDYYKVIDNPIDMSMIEQKIKTAKYSCEEDLVADLELMFSNAREYNEEDSQVYLDAEILESVLMKKMKSNIPPTPVIEKKSPKGKSGCLASKLNILYSAVKEAADKHGRMLSSPFVRLPSRSEYPDYYEVITKPIDLTKVHAKMNRGDYDRVDEMVNDLVLMFDNACTYNEPDSLIYKDALTLQSIAMEKKIEFRAEAVNEIPDVQSMVQEIFRQLFISTFNHADDDGRCFADSFQDMPAYESNLTQNSQEPSLKLTPNFDQVKCNLDKGRYRRLDRFQDDMFEVFEHARRVSDIDSQLYEDSVELQKFFIQTRDELCKNGEILISPALSFTLSNLEDNLAKEKLEKPLASEDSVKKNCSGSNYEENVAEYLEIGGIKYYVGDFVYLEPREKSHSPNIVMIEKISANIKGLFQGAWFYRQTETFHLATRKFLKKEVFLTEISEEFPVNRIIGVCFILPVWDYFKRKPKGFADEDVYVCEFKYTPKKRSFNKLKTWDIPDNPRVKLKERTIPLEPIREASEFTKVNNQSNDNEKSSCDILDKSRDEVIDENVTDAEIGAIYYEQLKTKSGWLKIGDAVYISSGVKNHPSIAMIDKLWVKDSEAYFQGPWFILPTGVNHMPTRVFYKHEVFRSSIDDVNPVTSIQGQCAVLSVKEYTTCRPTEISEQDVYICESRYIECDKTIRKITKPFKKLPSSKHFCNDEIMYFKKPISPAKEPSPFLRKAIEDCGLKSDDPSCNEIDGPSSPGLLDTSSGEGRETPSKDKKKTKKTWQPSGYILFSSEMRKNYQDSLPELSFGEISRHVGQKKQKKVRQISGYLAFAGSERRNVQISNPGESFGSISKILGLQWRDLEKPEKAKYEERAKKLQQEQIAKKAREEAASEEAKKLGAANPPPLPLATAPANSSASMKVLYNGQSQNNSVAQLFPARLPTQLQPKPTLNANSAVEAGIIPKMITGGGLPGPMFVAAPPKTQRLLHSEIYLKYIENMSSNGPERISDWPRTVNARPETMQVTRHTKLPIHWLGQGAGHHGSVVEALWALRDLMNKDSLGISRTLEFSQL